MSFVCKIKSKYIVRSILAKIIKLSPKAIKWLHNYTNLFDTRNVKLPDEIKIELKKYCLKKPTKLYRVLTSKSRGVLKHNNYKTDNFTSWSKSKTFIDDWGPIAARRSGDLDYKILTAIFNPNDTIVDMDQLSDIVEPLEAEVLVEPKQYRVNVTEVFLKQTEKTKPDGSKYYTYEKTK